MTDENTNTSTNGNGNGNEGTGADGSGAGAAEGTLIPEGTTLLKVGGRVITLEEAQEQLDRVEELTKGANKKFEAAAGDRKAAKRLNDISSLIERIEENPADYEAIRRLATYSEMRIAPERAEAMITASQEQASALDGDSTPTKQAPQQVGREQLSPELQRVVDRASADQNARIIGALHARMKKHLDSDAVVGDILTSEDVSPGAKERLVKFAESELDRRVSASRTNPDTAMLNEVAQTVRQFAEDFGLMDTGADGTVEAASYGGPMGTGPAPVTAGRSTLHRSKEPPKRVSAKDEEAWKDNIHARLIHGQASGDEG